MHYHDGFGAAGDLFKKLLGGAIGLGLKQIIRECYDFVVTDYTLGDEVYLIGFSHEIVSTASIAGLIAGAGPAYNVTKYGVVALSEGLRVRLAPLGIGVSVLCPGFIRTKIMNSERNVPQRFAGPMEQPPTEGPGAEFLKMVEDRVSTGIDPLYVGELVREGIEQDWPYIFTDNEFEPLIDERFAAIKQGFDRIRGREPRH